MHKYKCLSALKCYKHCHVATNEWAEVHNNHKSTNHKKLPSKNGFYVPADQSQNGFFFPVHDVLGNSLSVTQARRKLDNQQEDAYLFQ